MLWSKKKILSILSFLVLFLSACEQQIISEDKTIKEEETEVALADFFTLIQEEWSDSIIQEINILGYNLTALIDSLQFLPFENEYTPSTFIFYSKNKDHFADFLNNPYLKSDFISHKNDYIVWRKESNNIKILDISLEPHPLLISTLNIQKRIQE